MNKNAVFTQWFTMNQPKAAPFSIGGGGATRGPHQAPNALEDLITRLKNRYGSKAPRAVADVEHTLRETIGPAFSATPRGVIRLGKRDSATGLPRQAAASRGMVASKSPRQELYLFDPRGALGADVALHEAGHLLDPALQNPRSVASRQRYFLPGERDASRYALAQPGSGPARQETLGQAYGSYLQSKFPLPGAVRAHMEFNPIQARANEISARNTAASSARISELGGLRDSFANLFRMAKDPQLTSIRLRQEAARRIISRNNNTPAQEIDRLRTLPENLRPQMQDWFDAQRRRIDIAFGPGSGQRALAPILQHIGWGT